MNVMVVGLTAMAAYLLLMVLWLRYDQRFDDPAGTGRPEEAAGGENG